MQAITFKEFFKIERISLQELFKYSRNIIFALGTSFFLCALMAILLKSWRISTFEFFPNDVDDNLKYSCIFAPMGEEFIFRWMPISLAIAAFGRKIFNKWKWYYACILSIIFAFSIHAGYISIYIQGIGGFLITYVYYKNRKYMYLSGIIMHSAWNFTLGYILPTLSHYHPQPSFF